ncbi:MOS4 [Scenedesmus sp. PABB004]|nr:MOS4 [Scenedesmus sp. PABB004]
MSSKPAGAPLALEYHGRAAAVGHWRRGQELIDALAYIDPLTPDVKSAVDALIEEEMRRSAKRPADYLKDLPPVPAPKFEGHPALAAEYARVEKMEPMQQLDTTRYRLDPPPQAKRNDQAAWAAAAGNAHAQLEHQLNRVTNIELLVKYGANAWRAQGALDEALLKQLEAALAALRKQIDALNRDRKLQQSKAGAELRTLEDKYYSALRKNLEIDSACAAVAEEMARLEAQVAALGGGGGAQQQQANGAADAGQQQQQQQQQQQPAAEAMEQ